MQFIVKYSPEVTIKSRPVRLQICKLLVRNLRALLRPIDRSVQVTGAWDTLHVIIKVSDSDRARVIELIRNCTGIAYFLEVIEYPLVDIDDIAVRAAESYLPLINGKSFAVRCKRAGKQVFKSGDVEREVGAKLLQQASEGTFVKLKQPDVTVRLEVRGERLFVAQQRIAGPGGFPTGSLDPVLSLISGGFDSTVASYLAMRRGLDVHFLFFNLGGNEHRVAVQEIALYLWMKFGSAHRIKFIAVPFEDVVSEILRSVDNRYMGVVLKRLMMRAAEQVCKQHNIKAMVTGEAVAQVSSQTLTNLAVIDQSTDMLVLRPLAFMDKTDIIRIAAEIGTEDFSKHIPEYCGVISNKPKTRAKLDKVLSEEARFNDEVLQKAIDTADVEFVDQLAAREALVERTAAPAMLAELNVGDTILDIRHPNEVDDRPLSLAGVEVVCMPFYELNGHFAALPKDVNYHLYCERGMMSRLHANYLADAGHANVAIYRPATKG